MKFLQNFVPVSGKSSERDVFMELDPLGVKRLKSAIDRKRQFNNERL